LIESEERLSSAEVSMPASDAFHETARVSLLGASGGDVESETTSGLTLKEGFLFSISKFSFFRSSCA
jgi:hypothetical protein